MPYISRPRRQVMNNDEDWPDSAGELNYCLTQICLKYLNMPNLKYQHYNDVIGALEACKLEFYRRAVAPYEEKKISENGDVYP